jgi:hypothetical protein
MNATSRFAKVVIAFGACGIAAYSIAQQPVVVDRPDLSVGDKWVVKTTNLFNNSEISTFEQAVTELDTDIIKLERVTVSSAKSENIGRKHIRKADRSTWSFINPTATGGKYVTFSFPLELEKLWDYEFSYTDKANNTGVQNGTARAVGWEDVKVPAGSFKAIKVIHKRNYIPTGIRGFEPGTWTETYWYVPEVKWWVKYEAYHVHSGRPWDHTLHELVSFDVKH